MTAGAGRRLRAEIVAVGTELVVGQTVDTSSAWVARRAAERGVEVTRHIAVGDDDRELDAVLGEACDRSDVVVVMGGLGPTSDDRTRQAVARVSGRRLVRRPELVEMLERRYAQRGVAMPSANLVQADLPEDAEVVEAVGTAAGFVLDVRGARVWCLPGVPREMTVMATRSLLPWLRDAAGAGVTRSRVVRTAGVGESAIADMLADVDPGPEVAVAYLAARGEVAVRLTASAPDDAAVSAVLDPVVDEVVGRLGPAVTALDDEGLEDTVHRSLAARGWTLGLAESVTGGAVSARLASVPGASERLLGCLVTYATSAKSRVAGLDEDELARHGPVAAQTVAALARAARDRFGADVGAAVVGVAGPTTQGDEPVGRVRIAVAPPGVDPHVDTRDVGGLDRTDVIERAVAATLDALRRACR